MASGWPKSAPPATEGSEARLTCDLRLKMMEFARDSIYQIYPIYRSIIEGSLEVKLPTIWTDEKQGREEAERRGRLEERRSEEKE